MRASSRRASSSSCTKLCVRRACLLAITALVIGCDSTHAASGAAGLWGGRVSSSPTDSFTLNLTQNGSEVTGWGVIRDTRNPTWTRNTIGAFGTISGNWLDLKLSVSPGAPVPYYLRGLVAFGRIDSKFGYNLVDPTVPTEEFQSTLRRIHPPSEIVGTWAVTSTTGGDQGLEQLYDTIVVAADGRARRHYEWFYAQQPEWRYSVTVLWSQRGKWLVIEHPLNIGTDSLLIQAGELVHDRRIGTTLTDHYTRVTRSVDMTPPSLSPNRAPSLSAAIRDLHLAPAASTPAP
jgi:hypothetical protein